MSFGKLDDVDRQIQQEWVGMMQFLTNARKEQIERKDAPPIAKESLRTYAMEVVLNALRQQFLTNQLTIDKFNLAVESLRKCWKSVPNQIYRATQTMDDATQPEAYERAMYLLDLDWTKMPSDEGWILPGNPSWIGDFERPGSPDPLQLMVNTYHYIWEALTPRYSLRFFPQPDSKQKAEMRLKESIRILDQVVGAVEYCWINNFLKKHLRPTRLNPTDQSILMQDIRQQHQLPPPPPPPPPAAAAGPAPGPAAAAAAAAVGMIPAGIPGIPGIQIDGKMNYPPYNPPRSQMTGRQIVPPAFLASLQAGPMKMDISTNDKTTGGGHQYRRVPSFFPPPVRRRVIFPAPFRVR
jgi:hypothetical protein